MLLTPTEEGFYYKNFYVGQDMVNVFSDRNNYNYIKTIDINTGAFIENDYPLYYLSDDIGFYKDIKEDLEKVSANEMFEKRSEIVNEVEFNPPHDKLYGYGVYDLESLSPVSSAKFSMVSQFENGRALVTLRDSDDVCIIDKNGEVVVNISEKYDINNDEITRLYPITNGRVIISFDNRHNLDDINGCTSDYLETSLILDSRGDLISDEYYVYDNYNSGLVRILENDKMGYVNLDGNIILEPNYDYVCRVYNDSSLVVKDNILYQFLYEID